MYLKQIALKYKDNNLYDPLNALTSHTETENLIVHRICR